MKTKKKWPPLPKAKAKVAKASSNLSTAIQALKQLQGMENILPVLTSVQSDIQEAHRLMAAMVADMETLNAEVETLKQGQEIQHRLTHLLFAKLLSEDTINRTAASVTREIRAFAQEAVPEVLETAGDEGT